MLTKEDLKEILFEFGNKLEDRIVTRVLKEVEIMMDEKFENFARMVQNEFTQLYKKLNWLEDRTDRHETLIYHNHEPRLQLLEAKVEDKLSTTI